MREISPRTVLAIDDDIDLLALMALILEEEGYLVRTAENGQQGLCAVEEGLPDLILLDMKMPVMSGWEFAQRFRARYGQQVPIVVVSAAEDAERSAREVGATDWISKPFDLDRLVAVVGLHCQ